MRMLSHKQVWDGIDKLAAKNRLSASALAKRAGLDPTTFNKSKRTTKQGKARWPSTESVSKILEATSTSMAEFVGLMTGDAGPVVNAAGLPAIALAELKQGQAVDASGFLNREGGRTVEFPAIDDEAAYVVELDGDVAPPYYRSGDHIVVSPSSGVRRGDRVIGRQHDGSMIFGTLVRRTPQRVVVHPFNQRGEDSISSEQLAWLARIVWLTQ